MNATLDTVNGQPTLRFERRLRHAPEKVWKALTDPAELTAWFPQDLEGTFAPGAKLRFVFRGEPPVMVMVGGTQAFCGNDDCTLLLWDRSLSLDDNLLNAGVVKFPPEEGNTDA